jgi:hypothetical protein
MKLKLIVIFLSVVLILLMFGVGIAQGDDVGYPITGYPEPLPGYPIKIGYPVFEPIPMPDYPEPEWSSPEIVMYSNPVQVEPITPQYRNGRNLWQEIVYQFGKLLELMK